MAGKDGKTVAKSGPTGVGAVHDYGEEMAGQGFENTSGADYAIPFLGLLQSNSPEVDGSIDGRKIEDAVPGMMMNTVSKELMDGVKGVVIIPCMTAHEFIEWKDREKGGGFVGVHATTSAIVQKAIASAAKFGQNKSPEGNDLSETFSIYGMLIEKDGEPCEPEMIVVAFGSTKIKKYKQIMYRLRTVKGGAKFPLFAHTLRITSVNDKNAKGAFKNFEVQPAIENDVVKSLQPPMVGDAVNPLLTAGQQLKEQIQTGVLRAAHDSQSNAKSDTGGDDVF